MLENRKCPIPNSCFVTEFVCTGHYLPAIADAIYEANLSGKCNINLQGVIMGSPWTAPVPLVTSYPDYAEFHGLITEVERGFNSYVYCA